MTSSTVIHPPAHLCGQEDPYWTGKSGLIFLTATMTWVRLHRGLMAGRRPASGVKDRTAAGRWFGTLMWIFWQSMVAAAREAGRVRVHGHALRPCAAHLIGNAITDSGSYS